MKFWFATSTIVVKKKTAGRRLGRESQVGEREATV
jgi:hypothetical protein